LHVVRFEFAPIALNYVHSIMPIQNKHVPHLVPKSNYKLHSAFMEITNYSESIAYWYIIQLQIIN